MARTTNPRGDPAFRRALVLVALVAATVGVLFATRPVPESAESVPGSSWAAYTDPASARSALAELPDVEVSPEIAYDRERDFGPAWADVDHNGCDTRNDILARDLSDVTTREGTADCVVSSGWLVEPFTGEVMEFSKSDPAAIQIDHLIPLHAAWILGAWQWTPEKRLAFANDPRNLVAVDGPANQAKSDSLVDRWRPPNQAIHCVYALNTVEVHDAYDLGVTAGERRALESMLDRCE